MERLDALPRATRTRRSGATLAELAGAARRLPAAHLATRRRHGDLLAAADRARPAGAVRDGRPLPLQWDKDSVDDARMIKIDFLALGMLSAVDECLDLIEEHHGKRVDLSRIDFEDERVYDSICDGDTMGVFQIESRAQMQTLPRTQPRNLDDLTVQVAIIRPGPIVGGSVNPYINRRLRNEPVTYRSSLAWSRCWRRRWASCSTRSRCSRWRWRWPASAPGRRTVSAAR